MAKFAADGIDSDSDSSGSDSVLRIRLRLTTLEALVAYAPVAAWLLAAGGVVLSRPFRFPLFLALTVTAATLWALARERRSWLPQVHLAAAVGAGILTVLGASGASRWWPAFAGLVSAGMVGAHFRTTRHRLKVMDEERRMLARQVDRRINEIFSLQELSYILAESLQS